ncbi:hypothetical protein EBU71_01160 [bacterium]|nr:hypothetical protein [Candidatus Elulimicrobium humile]
MTYTSTNRPTNINPLNPNGFKFGFSKITGISYFVQSINLPDITLGEPTQNTPLSPIYIPGEILTYGSLNLEYIVDEDMTNYMILYKWLIALGKPKNYSQYGNIPVDSNVNNSLISELAKNYSDATLTLLNNNNQASRIITFKDCFPTSINAINFDASVSDVTYVKSTCTFRYSYYTISSPNSTTSY